MEAIELRIGNFHRSEGLSIPRMGISPVLIDGWVYSAITAYGIYQVAEGNLKFESITLTEEWLLKFGFEKDRNGYRLKDLYSLSFTEKLLPCFNDRPMFKRNLQYVHQLQNLYFTLTGEELTIQEIKQ